MEVGPGLCSVPRCLPRAGISLFASGSKQFFLPRASNPFWSTAKHRPSEQRPQTPLLPSSLRELGHLRNEGPLDEARDFNTSIQR